MIENVVIRKLLPKMTPFILKVQGVNIIGATGVPSENSDSYNHHLLRYLEIFPVSLVNLVP